MDIIFYFRSLSNLVGVGWFSDLMAALNQSAQMTALVKLN
jgi:hypothetical protein